MASILGVENMFLEHDSLMKIEGSQLAILYNLKLQFGNHIFKL
jgi:hypothetical protein